MVERLPAPHHHGGYASRLTASPSRPARSAWPRVRSSRISPNIKGVYSAFPMVALNVGTGIHHHPRCLGLPFCAAIPIGVKPSLSVASRFAWCATSMLTSARNIIFLIAPRRPHEGRPTLRSVRFASADARPDRSRSRRSLTDGADPGRVAARYPGRWHVLHATA